MGVIIWVLNMLEIGQLDSIRTFGIACKPTPPQQGLQPLARWWVVGCIGYPHIAGIANACRQ